MNRCPQCFGPNDDVNYSHLCHACLAALEPTPQEQKVAPPVDGQSKSAFTPSNGDTPAVVGLESVAFMTHHDEPMLFPTWDEAVQYCDDDESPISLYSHATVAQLQAENEEQARLLGISGSREAKLLAEIEALRTAYGATVLAHGAELTAMTQERDNYKDMLKEQWACPELATITQERDDLLQARAICHECAKKIDEAAGIDLVGLNRQLAASQSYAAQLQKVLEEVLPYAKRIEYSVDGTPDPIIKAIKVLALPQDDTALREWGAKLLEEIADNCHYDRDADMLRHKAAELMGQ